MKHRIRPPLPTSHERRIMRLLIPLLVAATLTLPAGFASAAWPERPVTMIVPFAAGGPSDAHPRQWRHPRRGRDALVAARERGHTDRLADGLVPVPGPHRATLRPRRREAERMK